MSYVELRILWLYAPELWEEELPKTLSAGSKVKKCNGRALYLEDSV